MEPQRRDPKFGPKRVWKDFRTNMMYWRFRHITRNRLRLKSWWSRRRSGSGRSFARQGSSWAPPPYRGMATHVHRGSQRRSLLALAVMVILLTALTVFVNNVLVNPTIVYGVGTLIIVGAIYWALKGV